MLNKVYQRQKIQSGLKKRIKNFLIRNFDFKNGCENEFEGNKEKYVADSGKGFHTNRFYSCLNSLVLSDSVGVKDSETRTLDVSISMLLECTTTVLHLR